MSQRCDGTKSLRGFVRKARLQDLPSTTEGDSCGTLLGHCVRTRQLPDDESLHLNSSDTLVLQYADDNLAILCFISQLGRLLRLALAHRAWGEHA